MACLGLEMSSNESEEARFDRIRHEVNRIKKRRLEKS